MALIALGVTGGIGAYKAVEVARGLQKRGHEVVAVMTHSATRFVGPVTFEAITRRRVITDQFEPGANADIEHIALASTIDLLVIAPATANIVGKLAHGIADDFLSTLYTATRAPVLLAPAMNTQMFEHEAVRRNLDTLAARGVRFVDPGEGYLACGWIGKGRLAEPEEIVAAAEAILRPQGPLRGQRVLVTAGPTYEDVDPVRYIGNRSSGRMGYAIAAEAARRGAEVTLVTGPSSLEPPPVREVVRVRSAAEMHQAVMTRAGEMQVAVMAAAVADYAPADRAAQKVPKNGETVTLVLKRTPDILGDLGQRRLASGAGPVLVGSPPRRRTSWRARPPARAQARTSSCPATCGPIRRVRRRRERGHDRRRHRRGGVAAAVEGSRGGADSGSSRKAPQWIAINSPNI
jgi:phosphopantothenoylcysteine decarboxylase/phosphopantothenate--cysteine ligase